MSTQQGAWNDPYSGGGGSQMAMPSMTPVVKKIVIANIAIWVVLYFASRLGGGSFASFVLQTFGVLPVLWKEWFPFLPVWQPLSYGFVHLDAMHVLFNMLGVYFFGTMLEGIIGSRRFLAVYLGAILFSGLCVLLLGLFSAELANTIGASGGVLAIVVATAVLRPNTPVIFIIFPMTLKVMAMIFVGLDLLRALDSFTGAGGNVSWMAHLSGAAFGFFIARKGVIWRDPVQAVETWREGRMEQKREHDGERLDRLLEKINREGIHSLSASEKAFLKRASKRQ